MCALITTLLPHGERGPEGHQLTGLKRRAVDVYPRHRQVRVGRGVAVPGEVLDTGGHSGRLEPFDIGGGVAGHQLRVRAEGPYADHRVARVGVDVGRGRPVEVDPAGGQPPAQLGGDRAGQLEVVHRAEREVAGEGGAAARFEPGDVAALLVGGDQHLRPYGTQLRGERGQLFGRLDVAGEQPHRAQPFAEQPQQPLGGGGADEARLEDGERVAGQDIRRHVDGNDGHPFTAPAVRPEATLR